MVWNYIYGRKYGLALYLYRNSGGFPGFSGRCSLAGCQKGNDSYKNILAFRRIWSGLPLQPYSVYSAGAAGGSCRSVDTGFGTGGSCCGRFFPDVPVSYYK